MTSPTNPPTLDPQQWPNGLQQIVETLGDPISVHRTPRWLTQIRFIGGGAFFFSAMLLFSLVSQFGRPEYLAVAIPMMFTALSMVSNGIREWGLWVLTFPTGLVCWKRRHCIVFAWQEIWEIYLGHITKGARYFAKANAKGEPECAWIETNQLPRILGPTITLVRHDLARYTLSSSLDGFAELSRQIQQATFLKAWDYCENTFRANRDVWFGDWRVSQSGLIVEDQEFTWEQIDNVLIAGGYLQIRSQNHWQPLATIPLEMIPNPQVLLALIALGGKTNVPEEYSNRLNSQTA